MPAIPDFESALEQKGLMAVTLTVLVPVGGHVPTVDQVIHFLADRSIIGEVQDGALGGFPGTIDITCAIFEDETIALTSPTGSVGHGQQIHEFCAGAAYGLQADVVLEGELRFDVRGQSGPYDHEQEMEQREYHNRTLSICAYPTPMPAYCALLGIEGTGQYGMSGDHVVISPDFQYLIFPSVLEDLPGALPLVTFQRTGQLRSVALALEADAEPVIVVGSGPRYIPLPCGPEGSESHHVTENLGQTLQVWVREDLPKRASKVRKTPLQGYDQFDLLEQHGAQLSRVAPEQFFVEVGKVLGYSTEILAAIETLETRTIATTTQEALPTHLGPIRVTTVDSAAVPTRARIATTLYLENLLGKPSGTGMVKNTWLRFRNTAVYQAIVLGLALVVAVAIVGILTVPAFYEWLELSVNRWYLAFLGCAYIVMAAGHGFVWFLGRRRARELLAQAQADGVYTFAQRAAGTPVGFTEYR